MKLCFRKNRCGSTWIENRAVTVLKYRAERFLHADNQKPGVVRVLNQTGDLRRFTDGGCDASLPVAIRYMRQFTDPRIFRNDFMRNQEYNMQYIRTVIKQKLK